MNYGTQQPLSYSTPQELRLTPLSYATPQKLRHNPENNVTTWCMLMDYLVSVQNMTETYLKISSKMCRGRVSNTANKNISLSTVYNLQSCLQRYENQGKDDIKPKKPRQSARENKRRCFLEQTVKTENACDEDKKLAIMMSRDRPTQTQTQRCSQRCSFNTYTWRTCYYSPCIPS
jgi:hypothetical protein